VPAALARRRSRAAVSLSLAGLAAVWVIPALLLRPLADPALLGFGTGFVVWIGTELIRNMANVRNPDQFPTPQVRLLTVRTWTGPCTIDMRDLKRVRARRSVSKVRIIDHIMVTDGAGVRIAFAGDNDRGRPAGPARAGGPGAPATRPRAGQGLPGRRKGAGDPAGALVGVARVDRGLGSASDPDRARLRIHRHIPRRRLAWPRMRFVHDGEERHARLTFSG
jgi:hypothetical protein